MADALVLSKLLAALVLLALFAMAVTPRHRLNAKTGDRMQDTLFRHPRAMHWLGMTSGLASYAAGVFYMLMTPHSGLRQLWSPTDVAAALLTLAGLLYRLWAMAELGKFFTFTVGIRTGHQLIRSGPYRLVRHPSYTGMVLGGAGFVVFVHAHTEHPWVLAVLTPVLVCFLFARVRNEESVLRAEFGRAWDAHCARTWRFLPYIF